MARVDEYFGDRKHQWLIRHITVLLRNLADADRHGDVVEHGAAVREESTDHHETTAELGVSDHDPAISVMPRVRPVAFDVLDAHADISPVKDQRAVLHEYHQAEAQRPGELHDAVRVLDFEHDVEDARDEEEGDQTEADYVHQHVRVFAYQRGGFE